MGTPSVSEAEVPTLRDFYFTYDCVLVCFIFKQKDFAFLNGILISKSSLTMLVFLM
jgi:hypothetical protein